MSLEVFDPVDYSVKENEFLLENIGKPPVVAMHSIGMQAVNPKAVEPILSRVYELIELEKHHGLGWCGVEAIQERIRTYLDKQSKWAFDAKRTRAAQRFPSMHSYDSRQRAHRSGPGSDSGKVRTYFDEKGQRVRFELPLIPQPEQEWNPGVATADDPVSGGITVDREKNRIECFCGHTESFNPESRGSFNAARARTSKHLRTAKTEVERHKETHTNEFGS